MWSAGCISGLIFLVNISAGMHLASNEDPLRRLRGQPQDQDRGQFHHHIQDTEKVCSVLFTELVQYNSKVLFKSNGFVK